MRKKNCISEFTSQRSECLLKNFRESLARQSHISISKAFRDAADAPAPRFWVSEARATMIIKEMLKGNDLTKSMYEEKRRMYREIFRRVKETLESDPSLPVGDVVFDVVNSEAPSSFLTADRVYRIVLTRRGAKL